MARKHRRDEWHQTKSGCWTRTLGERGMRIRLFQKRRGESFYRGVWVPGARQGRWDVRSLGTSDRARAEELGRALRAAELAQDRPVESDGPIALLELWQRYSTTAARFLDSKPGTRRDAEARARVLIGHFGERCDIRALDERDVMEYAAQRRAGGIAFVARNGYRATSPPTRARSAQADLVLLYTMLKWATTVRTAGGGRWLEHHPLAGVPRPAEANPRRPVATFERFARTRAAMQDFAGRAASAAERDRWVRMELALVLAEATGRRLGSIRQLRWEDLDSSRGRLRWRAEFDKKGRESVIPIPQTLVEELRRFQLQLSAVAGWMFPGERKPTQPMDRHLFDKWLCVAERAAGLPKLVGGLWHPYRRKWATERKACSIKDVAFAGGWKDVETLLTCYQQPDDETVLAVMAEPKKLRESVI